jgi:hypothetical protein
MDRRLRFNAVSVVNNNIRLTSSGCGCCEYHETPSLDDLQSAIHEAEDYLRILRRLIKSERQRQGENS